MKKILVFGIFRETSHSPEREYDDAAILRQTASDLAGTGDFEVRLFEPEEFMQANFDILPSLIFFMCEEPPYLAKLQEMDLGAGCLLVNTVESVENTFRENMCAILQRHAFFPKSRMVTVNAPAPLEGRSQFWLKRGDYHAITPEDVLFVPRPGDLQNVMGRFSARGIGKVLIQEHVPGDIIKFYCIRDCSAGYTWWFKWFYHKGQEFKKHPFSQEELARCCIEAGDSMGLDIYGGDAIVTSDGRIFIIDVNAWPSFALFRMEAARSISQLLKAKLVRHLGACSHRDIGQEASINLSA